MKKLIIFVCFFDCFLMSSSLLANTPPQKRALRNAMRKPGKVPELDPNAMGGALVLLAGGLMLITKNERRAYRKK